MARIEIVIPRSNGEAVLSGDTEKCLWGFEIDFMVIRGRLSIHLQKASQMDKEWREGKVDASSVPEKVVASNVLCRVIKQSNE